MSFCVSPSTHSCPLTLLDFVSIFFDVSYKQRVSWTTEASALRFCDAPANLSPTEVLVAWRNHLYPNRLQIGEAVVFCCVLLFLLHRDLLLSNAVWVPSSGSRLQGFTTLFKQLLLVHCRKRNGWEDGRDKMDTGDYISLVSLRSPWPLIIIQLWFLQRMCFWKKVPFCPGRSVLDNSKRLQHIRWALMLGQSGYSHLWMGILMKTCL